MKHQIAFQKHTDNAVSKTINLPENLPENTFEKDVEDIYKTASIKKAKAITIYRYNSKEMQVIYRAIKSAAEACKVCPVP